MKPNVELIKKVIYHLENEVIDIAELEESNTKQVFDMDRWFSHIETDNYCETIGCLAGWLCELSGNISKMDKNVFLRDEYILGNESYSLNALKAVYPNSSKEEIEEFILSSDKPTLNDLFWQDYYIDKYDLGDSAFISKNLVITELKELFKDYL